MALIVTPGTLSRRADFYLQLAGMLTAGVPIIQAFEMLKKNRTAGSFRRSIETIVTQLQKGFTLAESLKACGSWIPNFDTALISAGEQSGRLDQTMKMLGTYYQDMASLSREVVMGMLYPLFLVNLALLIFPASLLTHLFFANGVEQLIKEKALAFGLLYGTIIVLFLLCNARFGAFWRELLASIANAVPVLGKARKNLALARFSAALEALISAGVTIIEAWRLAAEACGSAQIRRSVEAAVPRIQAGLTPGEAVQQMPVFPEVFRNLYATGEISGQIDSTLTRLHNLFQENARVKFQAFREWLPRLVFLCIALVIGYQIITFYIGYFDSVNKAISM
jgi:type IV pilus assembly protein PilC